jgi:sugar O-acyltransferase (sialic acid O-acetyltransferase NeuD family)
VADAIIASGRDAAFCFRDRNAGLAGKRMLGRPILHPECDAGMEGADFHVAIGSNDTRRALALRALDLGGKLVAVQHPAASLSSSASIGSGIFVAAMAVIGPEVRIGDATIINHSAVIDHDCQVGSFAHVAPGAVLGGGVKIGDLVLIGANATVLPGIKIGAGAIVGAGAVVTRDVPSGEKWVGIPASAESAAAHD